MSNTLHRTADRQEVLSMIVAITLAELVAASNVIDIDMPAGAVVVGGDIAVLTVFNTTSTDTVTVGDSASASRYLGATSIKSAARTALVPTGYNTLVANTSNLRITRTPADTDATGGVLQVIVNYVVVGRGEYTQG